MNAAEGALCSHCLVPAGANGYRGLAGGEALSFCCFGCYLAFRVRGERGEEAEASLALIRLGVGAFLTMNVMVLSLLLYAHAFGAAEARLERAVEIILWALSTPAMAILGLPILADAWRGIRRGRLSTEAMIVVGAGAAYLYSAASLLAGGDRVYFDTAAMLLLLFTLGRYLDAATRARAARDLAPLLEAERTLARVVTASGIEMRPAGEVAAGERVEVRPGERFPVDGEVLEGRSWADEALVTGEGRPVAKAGGDRVIAGTTNGDGPLVVATLAAGAATHWAEIGRAVRDALDRRSRLQGLTDRITTWFLPAVLAVALAAGLYWSRHGSAWDALSATLATLVVACPCALGPAAYLASFLVVGEAARRGTVIRSTRALEQLAAVRTVVFDKTGSLTRGEPSLVALETAAGSDDGDWLGLAASLAAADDHPLSRALVAAARERGIEAGRGGRASGVESFPGEGLVGRAGESAVALGSPAFFARLGWTVPPELGERAADLEARGSSLVLVGRAGRAGVVAAFEDEVKREAPEVIAALGRRGIAATIVSGDRPAAVARVASGLGVADWRGALSPVGKVEAVRELMARGGAVAMVGDGLNDAPVLAAASVGIALGSGTELARTSAEVVTAGGDLSALPPLLDAARAALRTTRINLAWAFGYNAVGVAVAAAGLLQPVVAAGLMAISSVVVVASSLRGVRTRDSRP